MEDESLARAPTFFDPVVAATPGKHIWNVGSNVVRVAGLALPAPIWTSPDGPSLP